MKTNDTIRIISNILSIQDHFKGKLTEEEEFFVEYSNTIASLLECKILHNYIELCKTYNEVCVERGVKPKIETNGNLIGVLPTDSQLDTAAAMGVAMASAGIFDVVVDNVQETVSDMETVAEELAVEGTLEVGEDIFLSEEELGMLNL